MVFQRSKHRKYRKKKSERERGELKNIVLLNRKNLILKRLYNLPLDIKIRIYRYSINNHMIEWSMNHERVLLKVIDILEPIDYDPKMRITEFDGVKDLLWKNKVFNMCHRRVKEKFQENIFSVPLQDVPESSIIRYREWTNRAGYYWYHNKCRCQHCDMVKYHGLKYLKPSQQKKYSRITWNHYTDRWLPKTKSLHKYEKEEDRRLLRMVRRASLIIN